MRVPPMDSAESEPTRIHMVNIFISTKPVKENAVVRVCD
jgi:hypothetical protein